MKFLPSEEDDTEYMEVSLRSWINGELDEDMKGMMFWPPPRKAATPLIKMQSPFDPKWKEHPIQVMRFYGKKSKCLFNATFFFHMKFYP